MIGYLSGVIRDKQPPQLLVEVQGIGYEIEAPMTTFYDLPEIGQPVKLFTHLSIREDAHTLFGFSKISDRALFRNLIKVNGVGAKLALTILSGMDAINFAACIHAGDSAALVKLPGIGKKTAERLIIEMRDRISEISPGTSLPVSGQVTTNPVEEAVSALIALGYRAPDASRMIRAVDCQDLVTEEIIRQALQGVVRS